MSIFKKILPLAALVALVLPASAMATPKAKVQFSSNAYAVAENASSATITVIRPRNGHSTVRLKQDVSVDYTSIDGTAKAGADYTATNGTLTFPACSGSPAAGDPCLRQTFNVQVSDNFLVDGARTLTLKLSNAMSPGGRAILGYPSSAVLVIADDDSTGVGSGSTFQTASASDYVSESAGIAPVYIIRSGDLTTGTSVHYSTADGAAVAGTDYAAGSGTLNFPSQATDAVTSIIQVVNVPLLHNPATDPQLRDFNVNLDIPAGSGGALGTPSSENVVIVNSDGPATLLWSSASYNVSETAGSVRLTAIAAGQITGNDEVDVDYQTADDTARAGVNYTASSDSLQFFADDLAESVDIPVQNDGLAGDKAFTTSLVNPTGGAIGNPGTATVNVLDSGDRSNEVPAGGDTSGGSTDTSGAGGTTTAAGDSQAVLGARQATPACNLVVKVAKKQKLLKQKGLKLKLRAGQACKVSLGTKIKQLVAKKKKAQIVRALRFNGKKASLTLQPGKAKTVTVKFTKKTLKAINKALKAHKKLVATVVVTERDSASKIKHRTLKITIRR